MLSYIWFFLIFTGIVIGAFTGNLQPINTAIVEDTSEAVKFVIGLMGVMSLWLGLMNVAERSGLIKSFSKLLAPITGVLFPGIPKGHPAMSSIVMNMVTNMFGAGNSATAIGLKAMEEMNSLNKNKAKATNAMCMFLVINMSSIQIVPLTVLKIRADTGSMNVTEIIGTSLIATTISTVVGILSVKILEKREWFCMVEALNLLSIAIIPAIMSIILIHGYIKEINIYDAFVQGAKDGFKASLRILPYLIAIFLAIGVFKRSGAMDILVSLMEPIAKILGIPKEVVPLALMRPISGSGSLVIVKEIISEYGPDSFVGRVASTMMGSAETIFYTMAVYFGAIGIKDSRHTLSAALISHLASIIASVVVCSFVFRG